MTDRPSGGGLPFPNVRTKLSAPTKKTAFEKQRLEAEQKRLREEAETAAVYKDFVASFDEDSTPSSSHHHSYQPAIRGGGFARGGAGVGKRHFTTRKRNAFERDADDEDDGVGGVFVSEREKRRMRESNTGLLAFENSGPTAARGEEEEEEEEEEARKPTVLMSSLPPNISKQQICELLGQRLRVDNVKIMPAPPPPGPSQPSPAVRKAATALVTFGSETPSSEIDSVVSLLNGKYMGYGFWLSIVRHLSSTAVSNAILPGMASSSSPFGAVAPARQGPAGRGGPHRGGFAPPSSFAPPGSRAALAASALQVHVRPPKDLRTLKLVHRTIEGVLTHGPEFEALLMSSDAVRNDPKFAFLWDARGDAGVYYRWKMWEIVTGYSIDKTQVPAVTMFDSSSVPVWVPPKNLKYEFAGALGDVVDDEAFVSDEEDEEDERNERGYLGVLERAKLIHLLKRLPTVTSKVRRGDVARAMAFAMEHAHPGAGEEVVDVLVANVLNPLSYAPPTGPDDPQDSSAAKVVALWVVSDVLSNSSLGVRAAWRYRQLFEHKLVEKRVFEHLGRVWRESGWGRMKAEKFRRLVVEGVLEGWEKWCVFDAARVDAFRKEFNGEESKRMEGGEDEGAGEEAGERKGTTRKGWRTVEEKPDAQEGIEGNPATSEDVDGEPMAEEDVDGEPMVDDDDVDGEPMQEDEDIDGEPMQEDEAEEEEEEEEKREPTPEKEEPKPAMMGFKMMGAGMMKRKRPKAEDMFADSD